jgi:hypothetical protein
LLGDQLVSIFLHGSLVLGGLVEGRSDIDLLVVIERPLDDTQLTALERLVVESYEAEPTKLDVRVVTRAVAANPTPAPPLELAIGSHRGLEVVRRVEHVPDVAVELSIVRATGRALAGEQPAAVIGAVPDEWLVAIGDSYLERWQTMTDDDERAELRVLSACRIWRFAAEGVHCSKADAGAWVLARDASLTAVEGALRRRAGESVVISPEDIADLLARVRGELAG